jgi:[ribosomal protein S5]-alanine N-acetyltransferase
MIYQNKIIIMRPFCRSDISERYRNWFNDPQVCKYNSHSLFAYTPEKMERFIKNIEDGGPDIIWAIFSKENKEHIGNCSIQSINWIYRSCEIAFVIGDISAWGQGIGTMVGEFMLSHAFSRINMNRVWTGTAAVNSGMRHVALKLGMKEEGVSRQGMYLSGEYIDVIHYGILRGEWHG